MWPRRRCGRSLGQAACPRQAPAALAWRSTDRTVKNMNDGLRQLAPGVRSLVRNLATHSTEEWQEQRALENLAALSLLAVWVGQCELLEADALMATGKRAPAKKTAKKAPAVKKPARPEGTELDAPAG